MSIANPLNLKTQWVSSLLLSSILFRVFLVDNEIIILSLVYVLFISSIISWSLSLGDKFPLVTPDHRFTHRFQIPVPHFLPQVNIVSMYSCVIPSYDPVQLLRNMGSNLGYLEWDQSRSSPIVECSSRTFWSSRQPAQSRNTTGNEPDQPQIPTSCWYLVIDFMLVIALMTLSMNHQPTTHRKRQRRQHDTRPKTKHPAAVRNKRRQQRCGLEAWSKARVKWNDVVDNAKRKNNGVRRGAEVAESIDRWTSSTACQRHRHRLVIYNPKTITKGQNQHNVQRAAMSRKNGRDWNKERSKRNGYHDRNRSPSLKPNETPTNAMDCSMILFVILSDGFRLERTDSDDSISTSLINFSSDRDHRPNCTAKNPTSIIERQPAPPAIPPCQCGHNDMRTMANKRQQQLQQPDEACRKGRGTRGGGCVSVPVVPIWSNPSTDTVFVISSSFWSEPCQPCTNKSQPSSIDRIPAQPQPAPPAAQRSQGLSSATKGDTTIPTLRTAGGMHAIGVCKNNGRFWSTTWPARPIYDIQTTAIRIRLFATWSIHKPPKPPTKRHIDIIDHGLRARMPHVTNGQEMMSIWVSIREARASREEWQPPIEKCCRQPDQRSIPIRPRGDGGLIGIYHSTNGPLHDRQEDNEMGGRPFSFLNEESRVRPKLEGSLHAREQLITTSLLGALTLPLIMKVPKHHKSTIFDIVYIMEYDSRKTETIISHATVTRRRTFDHSQSNDPTTHK